MNDPGSLPEVPHVHVVIPAYNAAPFIGHAVSSALAQESVRVQVTVVDAGSTDGTSTQAHRDDPRLEIHRSEVHLNAAAARNLGMGLVDAPWLAFLDADDLWPSERSRRLIEAAEDAGADIAYGHMLVFNDGTDPGEHSTHLPPGSVAGLLAGSIVMRRRAVAALGPMDESLSASEFVDWMARARRLGIPEVAVPAVALLRRSHSRNLSRNRGVISSDYLRTVARHLRSQQPPQLDQPL